MADLSPQPVPSQLKLFTAQIFVGVKKEEPCPPEGLQDLSLGEKRKKEGKGRKGTALGEGGEKDGLGLEDTEEEGRVESKGWTGQGQKLLRVEIC